MLRRLHRCYCDLLTHSLQASTWIELGLTKAPDAVENTLTRLWYQGEEGLARGISILEIYEQAERELLILGAPGSGKSTLLLHLAQALTARAEAEKDHPFPMILRLSSWAQQRPSLKDWLAERVACDYDGREDQ